MKKTTRLFHVLILTLALALCLPVLAQAQDQGLTLKFNKIIGYLSIGNGEAQGSMRLEAVGPTDLQRVVFTIDGQPLAEVSQAPFSTSFNTENYPLGSHKLSAVGYTASGNELKAQDITVKFVTAAQGMQFAFKILIPILVVLAAAGLLTILLPMLTSRGKKGNIPLGVAQNYSAGGTICKQCGHPYPVHFMAINIFPGYKLERCPNCGRIGPVRVTRDLTNLRAAEAAERRRIKAESPAPELSEEEKLRKELDGSRYQDF
jgi:hypothetical protein